MTLLYLTTSPRPDSISTRVGDEVVAAWQHAAGAALVRRDLSADPVPHVTRAWTEICDNLMRDRITALDRLRDGVRTEGQWRAWTVLEPLLDELVAADAVVIATPMYNFGVPSALKAWIDQVTFPRMDLSPRRFVVVAARGGEYPDGTRRAALEHQTRYLSDFLVGHMSVAAPDLVTVDLGNARVDPLLHERQEEHEASLATALVEAREVGRRLALPVAA